ncbi:MAG: potassium channel protein [Chloroflexota bacterium]
MTTQSGGTARATRRPGPNATRWATSVRGHVRLWIAVVLAATIIGSLGYVVLVGWSFEDGLYMTVTTMTTVGYNEVRPLDTVGRIWTMIVSIGGVVVIFGSIGIVAESVLSEVASGRREQRRMRDAVGALTNHFILCGYGRVGATVAREFEHANIPFVIVDINPASLETALADGYLVVEGDATRDEVLHLAGIGRARGLITTIDSDANNVYVTLSARAINPNLFIVARANYVGAESKVLQAGADRVVSPYTRAGRQIAELATRPRVADFIDYALSHGQLAFSMEEVEVAADGPLAGRTVASLVEEGIHLLAIVQGPGDYEPNPPADRVLAVGDGLIVSGASDTLRRLREQA